MPLFSLHILLLWLLQEAVTRWDSCSLNVDVEIKRHRNRSVAVRPSGRYRTLSLISPFWYNTLLPWRRLQQLINKGGGFSHVWGNVRDVIIFFSSVGGCLLSPSTIFGSSLSFVNIPPVCSETKSRPVLIFKYQSHVILFLSLSVEQTHILPKPIVCWMFPAVRSFFSSKSLSLHLYASTWTPGVSFLSKHLFFSGFTINSRINPVWANETRYGVRWPPITVPEQSCLQKCLDRQWNYKWEPKARPSDQ